MAEYEKRIRAEGRAAAEKAVAAAQPNEPCKFSSLWHLNCVAVVFLLEQIHASFLHQAMNCTHDFHLLFIRDCTFAAGGTCKLLKEMQDSIFHLLLFDYL